MTEFMVDPQPGRELGQAQPEEQGYEFSLNCASRGLGFPSPEQSRPQSYGGKSKSVQKAQLHSFNYVTSGNSLNLSETASPSVRWK